MGRDAEQEIRDSKNFLKPLFSFSSGVEIWTSERNHHAQKGLGAHCCESKINSKRHWTHSKTGALLSRAWIVSCLDGTWLVKCFPCLATLFLEFDLNSLIVQFLKLCPLWTGHNFRFHQWFVGRLIQVSVAIVFCRVHAVDDTMRQSRFWTIPLLYWLWHMKVMLLAVSLSSKVLLTMLS